MRVTRLFFVVVLALVSWIAAPVSPARAAGAVVHVDAAAILLSSEPSCVGAIYPTCTSSSTGVGLTLAGLRRWNLSLVTNSFRPCYSPDWGTWSLTAADGSGDGLSGTFGGFSWEPFTMEVTGGTGAYAGAVDAVPGGTVQNFGRVVVQDNFTGMTGCGNGKQVLTPPLGSLDFHLQ